MPKHSFYCRWLVDLASASAVAAASVLQVPPPSVISKEAVPFLSFPSVLRPISVSATGSEVMVRPIL